MTKTISFTRYAFREEIEGKPPDFYFLNLSTSKHFVSYTINYPICWLVMRKRVYFSPTYFAMILQRKYMNVYYSSRSRFLRLYPDWIIRYM